MTPNPFGPPQTPNAPKKAKPFTPAKFFNYMGKHAPSFAAWTTNTVAEAKQLDGNGADIYQQSIDINTQAFNLTPNPMPLTDVNTLVNTSTPVNAQPNLPGNINTQTPNNLAQLKSDRNTNAKQFETELNQAYAKGLRDLKQAHDDNRQAVENNSSHDDTTKKQELAKLDHEYQMALTAYSQLMLGKAKAMERICNSGKSFSFITNNTAINQLGLNENGLNLAATLVSPPQEVKPGDKFFLDYQTSIKRQAGGSRFNAPNSPINTEIDVKKVTFSNNGGVYPNITQFKDLATERYYKEEKFRNRVFGWDKYLTEKRGIDRTHDKNEHVGPIVRGAYTEGFGQLLKQDPNTVFDISEIIVKFPTLAERKNFIFDMVRNFGDRDLGIDADSEYKGWREEAIQFYGCDVKIDFKQVPAPTNTSATSEAPDPASTDPSLAATAGRSGAPTTIFKAPAVDAAQNADVDNSTPTMTN